jgi:ribosomal protein L18
MKKKKKNKKKITNKSNEEKLNLIISNLDIKVKELNSNNNETLRSIKILNQNLSAVKNDVDGLKKNIKIKNKENFNINKSPELKKMFTKLIRNSIFNVKDTFSNQMATSLKKLFFSFFVLNFDGKLFFKKLIK